MRYMRSITIAFVILFIICIVPGGTASHSGSFPPRYRLIDLGTLWNDASYANALNDRGMVVGMSGNGRFLPLADIKIHPFVWENGKLTDLNPDLMGRAWAHGINNAGMIVGRAQITTSSVRPCLYEKGRAIELNVGNGKDNGRAKAVSSKGSVVGAASFGGAEHAFLFKDHIGTDLGTLYGGHSEALSVNGSDVVVGWSHSYVTSIKHAFRWKEGSLQDLGTLGGRDSEAKSINADGVIVGEADVKAGPRHAFLWKEGRMIDLGAPEPGDSEASSINDQGEIVGSCLSEKRKGDTARHAVVWRDRKRYELNRVTVNRGKWYLLYANQINNRGEICGAGILNGKFRAFLLRPVSGDIRR